MKQNKSCSKTCQRAEKPDELAMIALHNQEFAKRFVDAFRMAERGKSCPQQK